MIGSITRSSGDRRSPHLSSTIGHRLIGSSRHRPSADRTSTHRSSRPRFRFARSMLFPALLVPLCGSVRTDQDLGEFERLDNEPLQLLRVAGDTCVAKQLEPTFRFVHIVHRESKPGDKFARTPPALCAAVVRIHRCSGTQQLVGDALGRGTIEEWRTELDYTSSEQRRSILQFFRRHRCETCTAATYAKAAAKSKVLVGGVTDHCRFCRPSQRSSRQILPPAADVPMHQCANERCPMNDVR